MPTHTRIETCFRLRRPLWGALFALASLALGACQTSEGLTWPAFGAYRLPYADGTDVRVNRDFETHSPIGRYDLKGKNGGPYAVVAAADGWVRFIVDSNTGHGTGDNNYVWIEHPYPYCQPPGVTWPGKAADYDATCVPCSGDFCNEWSKHSHMAEDSTTVDAGLSEGDWVTAGTFLGWESDIGHASGDHLHWEVAKLDPDHPLSNAANGWTHDWSGDGWAGSPNVLPSICGIGVLHQGETHTAAPCPDVAEGARDVTLWLRARSIWTTRTARATVRLKLSGPDEENRVTLSELELARPASFRVGRDGWLPWPTGAKVEARALRLVRPVIVQLDPNGVGRVDASQLILDADLVVEPPGLPPVRTRLAGPLAGRLEISVVRSWFRFSLDGGSAGELSGRGWIRRHSFSSSR